MFEYEYMFEPNGNRERPILCWCPYHDSLIGWVKYGRRVKKILVSKRQQEWNTRLTNFVPISQPDKLPLEVQSAIRDNDWDEVQRAAWRHREEIRPLYKQDIGAGRCAWDWDQMKLDCDKLDRNKLGPQWAE